VFRRFDVDYHTYYNIVKMLDWKTIIILEEGRFHINNKRCWKKFWRRHNKDGWLWVTFEKELEELIWKLEVEFMHIEKYQNIILIRIFHNRDQDEIWKHILTKIRVTMFKFFPQTRDRILSIALTANPYQHDRINEFLKNQSTKDRPRIIRLIDKYKPDLGEAFLTVKINS
jgi:hypothetical protein